MTRKMLRGGALVAFVGSLVLSFTAGTMFSPSSVAPATSDLPTIPPLDEKPGAWDMSLPSHWGRSAPVPNCGALPTIHDNEDLATRAGDPPQMYYRDSSWNLPGAALSGGGSSDYSTTNNQVEGVDEADIVKTDGRYVYFANGNALGIVRVYPPEAAALLTVTAAPGPVLGMFVDGDRLAVLVSGWFSDPSDAGYPGPVTRLRVYDISDRTSPRLVHEVSIQGTYVSSRMIDEYVYVVAVGTIYATGNYLLLPATWTDGTHRTLESTDVGYYSGASNSYGLTFLLSLRMSGAATDGCLQTILTPAYYYGYGTDIYVSEKNVYLALLDSAWWSSPGGVQRTVIHRFPVSEGRITYAGEGTVPGAVLNQFSMDEFEGFLRVATTTWSGDNDLYVLDGSLNVVGQVTGLAPGEQMHSARYMGDRAYLVTFKKIDPFFAIDLSDPYAPRLVGELKIPGFSDYLHPFGENHVIGLGKDAHDMGDFAWFQGLKLSLFDVVDPANPREVAQLIIGDRGTESEARLDHKAFLFDPASGLLVLPVDLAVVDREAQPDAPPETYGKRVWQGAYVLSVSLDTGFTIRGRISHDPGPGDLGPCYGSNSWYGCDPFRVRRSLSIGDYLYTMSGGAIEIHNVQTLEETARVSLSA